MSSEPRLSEAVALGLLHGPTELLPISSSAHVTLVPWLAGWPYAHAAPEVRKAFEVALHAGTAAALLVALRADLAAAARERPAVVALATLPPALVGLAAEGPIERRLGTPATIAVGLLVGAAGLALADRLGATDRGRADATAADAAALGVAQACALMPGVSRNGATLAAARARGFARPDAAALSWEVALPVIAGASALKGLRLARGGLPRGASRACAAGAVAAFASTLAAARLVAPGRRDRSPLPAAAYRTVLAAVVARRVWEDRGT